MKKISFCINTAVNEINHVKLLFRSLEKNLSSKEHEIIVFIDSDNQGTFEWLLTQKETFPNLKKSLIGIFKNIIFGNTLKFKLNSAEFMGLINSYFSMKSKHRMNIDID